MNNDFDSVSDSYDQLMQENIGKFGNDISYYAMYKVLVVKETISKTPKSILEFGCGTGRNLGYFETYFPEANIYAYDPSEASINIAKKNNSNVNFLKKDELNNIKYDLIFIAGVFHHIEVDQRQETMNFIKGVLENSGQLVVFEHNPYNPVTVRAVNTCPFDEDAIILKAKELVDLGIESGLKVYRKRYCLFFPAFLKKLRFIEKFLTKIPFGGQYYIIFNND